MVVLWKRTVSPKCRSIHPKLSGNCAFPQTLLTRKLRKISVFYAKFTLAGQMILVKIFATIIGNICFMRQCLRFLSYDRIFYKITLKKTKANQMTGVYTKRNTGLK